MCSCVRVCVCACVCVSKENGEEGGFRERKIRERSREAGGECTNISNPLELFPCQLWSCLCPLATWDGILYSICTHACS